MIPVIGLYGILAASFTLGKILLLYVPPVFFIGIRMMLAGLGLLAVYYAQTLSLKIRRKDVALFFLTALVHIFMAYVFEYIALNNMAPSCVALCFNVGPCFTAIFAYFLCGEVLTIKKISGFLIALGGVLFSMQSSMLDLCVDDISNYLLVFISVISGALGWILVRSLMLRGYHIMHINGFAMLLGGFGAYLVSRWYEPYATLPWGRMDQFIPLLLAIIILANVIFYNLYGYFLRRYSATLLSFIGFFTPLFTALYDWVTLGIQATTQFYVAMVVVTYGIYIFYQEELAQGYGKSK